MNLHVQLRPVVPLLVEFFLRNFNAVLFFYINTYGLKKLLNIFIDQFYTPMCLFHDLKWSNLEDSHIIDFGENSTSNGTTGRNCTNDSSILG